MANPENPIWLDLATGDVSQAIPDEDQHAIGSVNNGQGIAYYDYFKGIAAVGLTATAIKNVLFIEGGAVQAIKPLRLSHRDDSLGTVERHPRIRTAGETASSAVTNRLAHGGNGSYR